MWLRREIARWRALAPHFPPGSVLMGAVRGAVDAVPLTVVVGTDGTERWTVPQFRAYAHPHFAKGKAWTMRSTRREITFQHDVAWFDEDLISEGLGPVRGTGVLVRDAAGRWKIAQYNLSFPIPNDKFKDVKALIER
jgi:hypothetical protein